MTIRRFVRINEKIQASVVRLIGPEGQQLGIMPLGKAQEEARRYELDLVEVAPQAQPPVCRIMDFSKYKYEQEKRLRQVRRHQRQFQMKEIRIRPHIEEHDYQVKLKQLKGFLKKGNRVKVSLLFFGREMAYKEQGRLLLDRLIEDIKDLGEVERQPTLEGRALITTLVPK